MADPRTQPTFPTLLQQFFVDYLAQQRAVSRHTVASYRDTFQLLLLFAQKDVGKSPTELSLHDLDSGLILRFLDHLERERGNSVRSRNARLSAIRSFLKFAAHKDFTALATIEQNLAIPTKRHDRPSLGFLTRHEIDAILAAPDTSNWLGRRDRAMLALMYNTGARVSEVAGLRVPDLVLNVSPVVHLYGKGRKRRTVPIWKQTAATLRGWIRQLPQDEGDHPLFPGGTEGKALTRSGITRRLTLAVERAQRVCPELAGRAISPHTIRHTTAMHLLQAGVDITVIALWLGHESPTTTHIYLEADMAMKEAALSRLHPIRTPGQLRYRAPDDLMQFLKSL
ncbi:MAG: site-specific integrase [Sphingomonadaceae bacterium]